MAKWRRCFLASKNESRDVRARRQLISSFVHRYLEAVIYQIEVENRQFIVIGLEDRQGGVN